MDKKLIAIVPAGGTGTRAAGPSADRPKQYRLINGLPMLRRAVLALLADARVQQVRVIVTAGDRWVEQALQDVPRTVWRPCAGATRAQTVLNGIMDAGLYDHDWVLVHDAARPGLTTTALGRLIDACLLAGQGGLLALPVADTLKRAAVDPGSHLGSGSGQGPDQSPGRAPGQAPHVQETIDRSMLWAAQTPQMFPAGPLLQALQAAGPGNPAITDEASAMELAGFRPLLIAGSARNFKVTWPDDFDLMERWLA
ncbi:MAG: 2-C-methyl-D-erythritol 4-phosphate cytidylyltransferase [Burkholderiaceae bacterium]|jgi:2-C-methyl-D-erythritol 4-phosphate cytidylyltransferase